MDLLRAKGEFDRDTTLHSLKDAPDNRPVHGVEKTPADLLEVILRQGAGDVEGFVKIGAADVEIGDHVPAAKHGFGHGDCRG